MVQFFISCLNVIIGKTIPRFSFFYQNPNCIGNIVSVISVGEEVL